MVNKICAFLKQYEMVKPGDRVICAVSGGADSMALLWAMYLLKDKLQISLSAAHFNHHLRGGESNRDEVFVTDFCEGYGIPLYKGEGNVVPGDKGLEAAARDARYAFLEGLPGKVATAHTADDNAETLLKNPQYNISEISRIIGYENPLYFSRIFKKAKGLSPSDYRKRTDSSPENKYSNIF